MKSSSLVLSVLVTVLTVGLALLLAPADSAQASGKLDAKKAPKVTCKGELVKPKHGKERNYERTMRCLIKTFRKKHGLPRLDHSAKLRRAARRHSRVMARQDCFWYRCPGEASLPNRLFQAGYLTYSKKLVFSSGIIEVRPGRQGTPKAIFRIWRQTSDKRQIISDPYPGLDYAVGVRTRGAYGWVTLYIAERARR